jgi:hypothetical protein
MFKPLRTAKNIPNFEFIKKPLFRSITVSYNKLKNCLTI